MSIFIRKTVFLLMAFTGFLFAQNAWINEIHYDNYSTDQDEFIEVVIENADSYNLADFQVDLYNGNDGKVYDTKTLDQFTKGSTVDNFTFFYYTYPSNGIQNGAPDGMALSYKGNLISGQFLSYEGTMTAADGPANGQTSVDIGVSEPDSVGYSLQLGGTGTTYDAFGWQNPLPATPGEINKNQQFAASILPEPSNHVTQFQVDSTTASQIFLSWIGSVGAVLPNKYLVLGVKDGATFPTVQDGTPIPDDNDWSDGVAAFNVLHKDGKNTLTVSGLEELTTYTFKIYPYNNGGSNIDYKTDGTIPTATGTTKKSEVIPIAQVQKTPDGQEGDSPLKGQVVTLKGVVTGVSKYGYFIQDADSAWSGVYVYDSGHLSQVKMSDQVLITGTVDEYNGKTEIKDITAFSVVSQNVAQPKPVSIKTGELAQEKYEGVLVKVSAAQCTNTDLGYGEWEVDDGSGPCRIDDLLYTGFTPELGQKYNITGVCDYSYGNYKIEPRSEQEITLSTTAPVIEYLGVSTYVPQPNEDFTDTVKVTDNGTVVDVQLHYTVNDGAEKQVAMTAVVGDSIYVATIPGSEYSDGNLVKYWVYAKDNDGEESTGATQGFFAGLTNIGSLRSINADGELLYAGFYAKTEGVATVSNGVFDTKNLNVYMQNDNYEAINVFKYGAGQTPFLEGHKYTVIGQLRQYNGLTELVPVDAANAITDDGEATMPEPLEVNLATILAAPEGLEALLVKVVNVDTVAGTAAWPDSGNDANITISDDNGTNEITLRIDKDTNIDGSPEPTWPQTVIGILSQYDRDKPYTEGYQIIPRSLNDLSGATGIEQSGAAVLPKTLQLDPAYPNPFNPSTTLQFAVPANMSGKTQVSLNIYNILGQKVRTLVAAKKLQAGVYRVKWQARDDAGRVLPTGIYFAVLRAGNQSQSEKLILLK